MARPLDYNKWNNIEVSDDEDDTHPNIDTPSLFKWRHEARVQRMEELDAKKKAVSDEKKKKETEIEALKKKMATAALSESEMAIIKKGLNDLEKEAKQAKQKEEEVLDEELKMPLNVDTISQEGFSKSIINKSQPRTNENLSEEEREKKMRDFVSKNEKEIKAFGWLKKFDDSKAYMMEHTHLACEETANYLVIHCLNLEMETKHEAMMQVAHQCICVQYLLELSKQLDVDPRSCISSFFTKIQIADNEYKKAFEDELTAFIERIEVRAEQKIEEQMAEAEKEEEIERQNRLGPGGLDPSEVFETLPDELKECFESQDIQRLQETIKSMDQDQARYHMKRCVDSGLWKPSADDPDTNPEDGFKRGAPRQDSGCPDEEATEEDGTEATKPDE